MKVLRILLYVVLGVIALVLVVAAVMPNRMDLKSEIVINKPVSEVYEFAKILENQKYYSKWVMLDPNVKVTYVGTDGTVGAYSSWESTMDEVGVGQQEIIGMEENKRIDYELRFKVPFEATDSAYTTFEAIDSTHTKVTNGFKSKMAFPLNLMLPMVEKMLQEDLNGNMKRLDSVLMSR
jgi:uncharacterized protein YndB with AHSA1/START domain